MKMGSAIDYNSSTYHGLICRGEGIFSLNLHCKTPSQPTIALETSVPLRRKRTMCSRSSKNHAITAIAFLEEERIRKVEGIELRGIFDVFILNFHAMIPS